MPKFYINLDEDIANSLQGVSDELIIDALTQLAESKDASDELAAYQSVSDIMEDNNLSEIEKRQLKLKAERRSDISKR